VGEVVGARPRGKALRILPARLNQGAPCDTHLSSRRQLTVIPSMRNLLTAMQTSIRTIATACPSDGMVSIIIASVIAAFMLTAPCTRAAPEQAPDFKAEVCFTPDSLTLSDCFGFPAVLFFFDVGDAECFSAFPYLANWHAKYKADSLRVIGIHCPYYEPARNRQNALTAIARTSINFPVTLDLERRIYRTYSLDRLPVVMLLAPGGRIVRRASDLSEYREFEMEIQSLLRSIEPEVILPFLFDSTGPKGDGRRYPAPTPKMDMGYEPGCIVNTDSAGFDRFHRYTDPGGRDRGKAYLEGRWKTEDSLVTYQEGEEAWIRVIYSGKDVWLLPDFQLDHYVTVYIEQDRKPLPDEIWGEDIKIDLSTRTFISMRYAIPMHIVSNPAYGTHELKIIPEQGAVSFHYIFFEGTR
jgi:hypothetical protein